MFVVKFLILGLPITAFIGAITTLSGEITCCQSVTTGDFTSECEDFTNESGDLIG